MNDKVTDASVDGLRRARLAEREAEIQKDLDNLAVLPLAIIPLRTTALLSAKMVKNVRLKSVVEIFSNAETGSGQLDVSDIAQEFTMTPEVEAYDIPILRTLAGIPSYDVYSLRKALRANDIPLQPGSKLNLSKEKQKELSAYMTKFTTPLIMQVYGDELELNSVVDPVELFRTPDLKKARERLDKMSAKLGIDIMDVPKFLEDYGDTFMSLSYYRNCLDDLQAPMEDLISSMDNFSKNWQLSRDKGLMKTCKEVREKLSETITIVSGMFESFDAQTEDLWTDINAVKFAKVKEMVEEHHTVVGAALCSLSVKLFTWRKIFPDPATGGPVKRSEFIRSELKSGLDYIDIEKYAGGNK